MPISHARRCIFVHVPKTGGTSVESALGLHGRWQDENREAMFGRIQSPDLLEKRFASRYLQHLTIHELRDVSSEPARSYFSFAFVRNPWDRMVSIYHRTDPDLLEQARGLGIELRGISFAEFLVRTDGIEHAHLMPQASYLCDDAGREVVDVVGRFEHLARDFQAVCRRLQVEAALPHLNTSTHDDYHAYYDEASRRLVEERFRRDAETFSYTF